VTDVAPTDVDPEVDPELVWSDIRLALAIERLGFPVVAQAVGLARTTARDQRQPTTPDGIVTAALRLLPAPATGLRQVVNATGALLHTNLGRAPLSQAARDALQQAAGLVDLEIDLSTGSTGVRGRSAMAALAAAVPDAQAAHVVNNNAAAILLAATTLAQDREIVISRGEMIEIGEGFRLPVMLTSTGARLREIGTTNRTSLADYATAIGSDTAFILRVHPTNFAVTGFTSSVPVAELATLDVPVVVNLGSGLLAPDPVLPDEPDVASALRDGAALVTTSADKLIGGPQAGLLFGRADVVARLRRHPVARALRPDKLTLAALEATLRDPDTPTRKALYADATRLRERAEQIADTLREKSVDATAVPTMSALGGGAPRVLSSYALSLPPGYLAHLLQGSPTIVGRVEAGRCLLDLRTVPPQVDDIIVASVLAIAGHR
jgi:L-seryl-tRNA(Ser) seleniumtransferase